MSTQIQRRRGTTAEHSTFTGAAGEITIDSTKNTVVVHDGTTTGGFPLIKESDALSSSDIGVTVQAYDSNLQSFVTAITLPTSDGTAGQFLKTDGAGTVSFASIPTINTLNDVGNVTITSAASGEVLSWNGSAWVNTVLEAFDTQTATTTATTETAIATYATASYDGVKAVITAADSTAGERSITEIIITHDGTTAVATEYAQVNTATALATYDVDISGGNIRILATPASTNNTAFTVKAITL